MNKTKAFSNYFAAIVAGLDFEILQETKNRLMLHLLMWIAFSAFLVLSYMLAYRLSGWEAFMLTVRMVAVNASVFYLFFYGIIPTVLAGQKVRSIIVLLFSLPCCQFIWLAFTYGFSLFYNSIGFEIKVGELKGAIGMAAGQSFFEAISLKRMVSQAIIIISLLSPFFFIKILVEISKLYHTNIKVQEQKANLEIQNINIEKDFLKSQLNPHFLFNTLNNLYSLALRRSDKAPDLILSLSEIMSYTLYEGNNEVVPLRKELDFLQSYFALEKMRYPAEANIHCEICSDADIALLEIAPLLTFTFIENAFKYGLNGSGNAYVKMYINIHNGTFEFLLQNDNEPGAGTSGRGGIGLKNARKRLQLLYPGRFELEIVDNITTFAVSLTINLKSNEAADLPDY